MDWWNVEYVLCVAIGGAVGASLRFLVSEAMSRSDFPWATLTVNVVGSFMLALLMFGFGNDLGTEAKLLLFTGVMGGFTTMSTFSLETVDMALAGRLGWAVSNVALNLVLCIGGTIGGIVVGRAL